MRTTASRRVCCWMEYGGCDSSFVLGHGQYLVRFRKLISQNEWRTRAARRFTNAARSPYASPMIQDDPEYWRRRAEETRTMAGLTGDPEARRIMLNLAATYEALAKLAEATSPPP